MGREYKLVVESVGTCQIYTSVLRAICSGLVPAPRDDRHFPPPSLRKGYAEKAGRGGDWARRWLILGPATLLVFRDASCAQMVNAVPLDATAGDVKFGTDGGWTLSAAGRRWNFRNSKDSIARAWVSAVEAAFLRPSSAYSWLVESAPAYGAMSCITPATSAASLPTLAEASDRVADAELLELAVEPGRESSPSLVRTHTDWSRHVSIEQSGDPPLLHDDILEAAAAEATRAETTLLDDEQAVDAATPPEPPPAADPPSPGAASDDMEVDGAEDSAKLLSGKSVSDSERSSLSSLPHARAVADQMQRGHNMVRHFL